MKTLIQTHPTQWLLLVGPRSIRSTMMTLIARLAERDAVRVLDSGGQFDGYLISRLLRGHTNMRERITLSRTFTSHQLLSSLEKAIILPAPFIVLDFLHSFYDETIPFAERRRLLERCISHLDRLSKSAGGAVSVYPPTVPSPEADRLLTILRDAAPESWVQEMPGQAPQPRRMLN